MVTKPVLIIEVESPQWGDPIRTFRKAYSDRGVSINEGAVCVRKIARSVLADHADIQRLAARAASQAAIGLDLAVTMVAARPLARYRFPDDARERVVAAERTRLLAPLQHEGAGATGEAPRG